MSEHVQPPVPEAAAFRTSPQIDQIASALVDAQGKMFSPTRNKRVQYEKKRGGSVDFRYSTLDVINEMIRLPCLENGLCVMHVVERTRSGPFMRTRLLHRSGQWMENATPLLVEELGPQAYSSAQTLAMRYGICALLNIAAADDDDGNEAAGNQVRKLQPDLVEGELRKRLTNLIERANFAKTPLDVTNMLKAWKDDMHEWMAFAEQVDRADQWEVLTRLIPNALRRVFGEDIAKAWTAATFAKDGADAAILRASWTGDWKPARQAMKAAALDAYGLLREHMAMQLARVEREAEEADRRKAVVAAAAPPATASVPAALPKPLSCEVQGEIQPRTEKAPDVIGFYVLDEDGAPASDAVTAPIWFARMYASQHHGSTDKQALASHNARGLEWAAQDQDAALVLTNEVGIWILEGGHPPASLVPPPKSPPVSAAAAAPVVLAAEPEDVELPLPPPAPRAPRRADLIVPVPRTHRHTPDLRRYLFMVKVSLQRLEDRGQVPLWIEANSQTYEAMPDSTRLQVRAHVVACERGFGAAPSWAQAAEAVA